MLNLAPHYYEEKANANVKHQKIARRVNGINADTRFITQWHAFGKKKIAPHYWLEHMNCYAQPHLDNVEILHANSVRDAESHDSSYSSFCWNISQNVSKEKHRSATPGIAGW